MGLLSGVGPALKGLFATHDFGDSLSQARAFLDGDYGTGIDVAARRSRRRQRSTPPPVGTIVNGRLFLGGDPDEDASWQPLDGGAVAAGGAVPGNFGRW